MAGAVYPVFREMEEAGKARRGHFVDGYTGAQFAFAGVVDRLRGARLTPDEPELLVLAASDPAQPFGALLPWPTPTSEAARPRRSSGARVVLEDGELVAWVDRAARRVWSFVREEERGARERGELLGRGLRRLFEDRTRTAIQLEEIDGEEAGRSPLAEGLVRAGFRAGYKGLELERSSRLRDEAQPAEPRR